MSKRRVGRLYLMELLATRPGWLTAPTKSLVMPTRTKETVRNLPTLREGDF